LLGMVALVAFRSPVEPRPPVPSLGTVATVDLERVFSNLDEKVAADIRLQALADDLQKQSEAQTREIELLEQNLDLFPAGSEKYQEAEEKFLEATVKLQAYVEFGRRKIDFQKGATLNRLYMSIKGAARLLAERDGYAIVVVDDSIVELQSGTEAEMTRQISARRMLYASPRIDITDALIRQMNNAFQMRQAG
ncbi:MAG: OmpH/Skp family outer membrane protein, partial [Planctomycetota bacterium]